MNGQKQQIFARKIKEVKTDVHYCIFFKKLKHRRYIFVFFTFNTTIKRISYSQKESTVRI